MKSSAFTRQHVGHLNQFTPSRKASFRHLTHSGRGTSYLKAAQIYNLKNRPEHPCSHRRQSRSQRSSHSSTSSSYSLRCCQSVDSWLLGYIAHLFPVRQHIGSLPHLCRFGHDFRLLSLGLVNQIHPIGMHFEAHLPRCGLDSKGMSVLLSVTSPMYVQTYSASVLSELTSRIA